MFFLSNYEQNINIQIFKGLKDRKKSLNFYYKMLILNYLLFVAQK